MSSTSVHRGLRRERIKAKLVSSIANTLFALSLMVPVQAAWCNDGARWSEPGKSFNESNAYSLHSGGHRMYKGGNPNVEEGGGSPLVLAGQFGLGFLGGAAGMMMGAFGGLMASDGETSTSKDLDYILGGMYIGMSLGASATVYAAGGDEKNGRFLSTLIGASTGAFISTVMLASALNSSGDSGGNSDSSADVAGIAFYAFPVLGAMVGFYVGDSKNESSSNFSILPQVSARKTNGKTEWLAGLSLTNFRF